MRLSAQELPLKRFTLMMMAAMLLALSGLAFSACSNADFATVPNDVGIQAPLVGLNGGQENADVEEGGDADQGDATDVDVDAEGDEGDVDDDAGDQDAADPLEIDTHSLKSGQVGALYYDDLKGDGGSHSYRWMVVGGELPDGLKLCEEDGVTCGKVVVGRDASISGTPTAEGSFSFTLRITDAEDGSLEPAEKSFSIAIAAAPAEPEQGPESVVGVSAQALGISLKPINLPQTVMLSDILPMTSLAGMLTTPIMSALQIEGGAKPYEFKVVMQGMGTVAEQSDGSFKLLITHLFPLFKDVDHDPEIPVTVLVRDANGKTGRFDTTIKVIYPMDKVTDLSLKICFDADGTCSDSGLNTLSLIMIKSGSAYAGYCLGTDRSTAEVGLDECTEATTTDDEAMPGLGYSWLGLTVDLDEVERVLYWQFMVELGDRLYMTSTYWRAIYNIHREGDQVGTHDDITDVMEKTPLGKIWQRRPEKLLNFMPQAIGSRNEMESRIDAFLAGN